MIHQAVNMILSRAKFIKISVTSEREHAWQKNGEYVLILFLDIWKYFIAQKYILIVQTQSMLVNQ